MAEAVEQKKKRNHTPIAMSLWSMLVIATVWISVFTPNLDWTWEIWTLVIVGMAVTMDIAFRLTFGVALHYLIAGILVPLWLALYRSCRWAYRKILELAQKEEETSPVVRPTVAARALDAASVHPKLLSGVAAVLLGYDEKQRPIVIDLGDDRHTMIGASTGGGKTSIIRSILVQLASKPLPAQIYLIDLKSNPQDMLRLFKSVIARYINDDGAAIEFLVWLSDLVQGRNRNGVTTPRVIVVIDEVAMLTKHPDKDQARAAKSMLAHLSMRARSAGVNLVLATQDPVYTTVPKEITINMLRKLMLAVSSPDQARVIMDFRPDVPLPQEPGDFLLKNGVKIERGHALYTRKEEIDELLSNKLANFDDHRLQLWRTISLGRGIGDTITGINATSEALRAENVWATQPFVQCAYRNFALAGLIDTPRKGGSRRLCVEFVDGVGILKGYLEEKKWQEDPQSVVS